MSYQYLSLDNLQTYLESQPTLKTVVDPNSLVNVRELSDGNLNVVFAIEDSNQRSIVLKQALPYMRLVGPDWPLTPDRAFHEAKSLMISRELAGTVVPEVYHYDELNFVIAMENLSDYRVWRGALVDGLMHHGVATEIGNYIAKVCFGTSPFSMDGVEHRQSSANSSNPELCKITEDLVFSESVRRASRNSVLPSNQDDANELYGDTQMIDVVTRAKWLFMTKSEALIHGDLHTGSVMVRASDSSDRESDTKVIDPEFAFFGPVAFDIGMIWANYFLSSARSTALGNDESAQWLLQLARETWVAFESTFRQCFVNEEAAQGWGNAILEQKLDEWWGEAWMFCTSEIARRVVGMAKVADIETLDPSAREGAVRGSLKLARNIARSDIPFGDFDSFFEIAGSIMVETRTGQFA